MSHSLNSEFVKSSAKLSECPKPDMPEYAFIGRSNVGKSSLINMLTSRKKLAKISSKPGKTQLINHFLIDNSWYLVDLPGYGWAQVSKKEKAAWKLMIDEYIFQRQNLATVFVLVDSRHEPQKIDIEFINTLGEQGVPFAILLTKADKSSKNANQKSLSLYKKVLSKYWEELPNMIMTSSQTGDGKYEVLSYIESVNASLEN